MGGPAARPRPPPRAARRRDGAARVPPPLPPRRGAGRRGRRANRVRRPARAPAGAPSCEALRGPDPDGRLDSRDGLRDPRRPRPPHAGQEPDPHTGAVTTPIYATSTYAQKAVGEFRYDYSRTANPTREAFEACLASLKGAAHGIAFGSGMAATTTVMHLLDAGAHVVAVNDVYGGTYRLFSKVYEPKGYRFSYVTAEECNTGLGARLDGAAMLWLETPTNPL